MYCKFLSYKNCDTRQLASISKEFISRIAPPNAVCLSTCHRIEFYSNTPIELQPPPKQLAESWSSIEGIEKVLKRLATIYCGADSKILGENFIALQTTRPFLKTTVSDLPFDLIDAAFEISNRIKEENKFQTTFSYDTAAYTLLGKNTENSGGDLIIIGGGMLGQHMARNAGAINYSKVTIVTKSEKQCKFELNNSENSDIIQITNFENLILPEKFDLIIATDTPDEDYKNKLVKMMMDMTAGKVVDFCAVPLLQNPEKYRLNYFTMYGREFTELTNEANRLLSETRLKVITKIDSEINLLLGF